MAISFSCPHCGHAFDVADSYAGQTGPCAGCGKPLTVPGGDNAFAASAQYDTPPPKGSSAPLIIGLLAGGLVIMFLCGGVLLALLLPAIQAAREAARRNQCMNNCKNISLAFLNHSDMHRTLPLASTAPVATTPGSAEAGYSWLVPLLPYLEQVTVYDKISEGSNEFESSPFGDNPPELDTGVPVSSLHIPLFICSSAGEISLSADASRVYSTVPLPGLSNYLVTSASHLTNTQGPAELFSPEQKEDGDGESLVGNGLVPFPSATVTNLSKGLSLAAARDGMSNTVVFCESRETIYAAWIDGQATWGVGAWPENVDVPTADGAPDGLLGWPDSDMTSMTSLEVAVESRNDPSLFYMASSRFDGGVDRQYGPSSNHAGGVVNHAFADGHVSAITPDIDRNLYLRLISRDGGEAVQLDSGF